MKKQYVLFWGHFELPDKNALAHRVKANAEICKALGYKIILVGYSKDVDSIKKTIKEDNWIEYEIPYPATLRDWIKTEKNYRVVDKIIAESDEMRCKAVIVNAVGPNNTKGLIRLLKKKNIPLVMDIVDDFVYSKKSISEYIKSIRDKMMHSIVDRKILNIICISNYLQSKYKFKNTVVIPSLTYDADPRFRFGQEYEATEQIRVCYAGNPGRKGFKDRIDWCVKAFIASNVANSIMEIYGVTEKEFTTDFPEIELNSKITFMGRKSNKECISAIKKADFFTFAREDNQITKAGFPTKFSECMAIGTPVITTPTSNLTDYLLNGVNGYCAESCSYDGFAKVMSMALHTNKEQRRDMHTKRYSLDESNWREAFKSYLDSLEV